MKLKYRLLKITICLIVLVTMMYFSLSRYREAQFEEFKIKIVQNDEFSFVNKENIKQDFYANFTSNNVKIKEIKVNQIEQKIKKNPYIDSLNIYLDQDEKLNVYVTQRIPQVRINNGKGSYYISNDLIKIPISKQFSTQCLMVEGDVAEKDFKDLVELKQIIFRDNLLKKHIVGVKKLKDNSFNLLVNTDAFFIEFGTMEKKEEKLTELKAFYNQYLNHVGLEKYKKISLKYNNQIVATKK